MPTDPSQPTGKASAVPDKTTVGGPSSLAPSTTTTTAVLSFSADYYNGQRDTIRTVLKLMESSETRQYKEGLRGRNFTLGVINCFLVAYVFGRYPQHFWLLYFIEALVFLPLRWYQLWHAQPMNQSLYYLDYCWIMNLMGCFMVVVLLQDAFYVDGLVSDHVRKQVFLAFTGVCCGPLMGANYVLPFVALRFHDLVYMAAVFIHLMPPMVFYTLLWHTEEIATAWPDLFHFQYLDEMIFFPKDEDGVDMIFWPGSGLGSIAGNAVALYWLWFIPYVSWMLLVGLSLPRRAKRPYDTVFHSTLRGGPCIMFGKLWGRPEAVSRQQMKDNTYEVRDFVVYMIMHAFMINLALYVVGYFCYTYRKVHGATLCFMVIVCVYRGGRSYRQWASRTAFLIEKEFASVIRQIQSTNLEPPQKEA
jgi:Protein of unknown function (DUF2838)